MKFAPLKPPFGEFRYCLPIQAAIIWRTYHLPFYFLLAYYAHSICNTIFIVNLRFPVNVMLFPPRSDLPRRNRQSEKLCNI